MFISRLVLNKKSLYVRKILTDRNLLHKFTSSLFRNDLGENPRKQLCLLYEVTDVHDNTIITIQSSEKPSFEKSDNLLLKYETKDISKFINAVMDTEIVKISFMSEPSKKVDRDNNRNSNIIRLDSQKEIIDWVKRQMLNHGCETTVDENGDDEISIIKSKSKIKIKKNGSSFSCQPCAISCNVKITDKILFKNMLENGIGRGKSYGMGMVKVLKKVK